MRSRFNRLVRIAIFLAIFAACLTGMVVASISRDAASVDTVILPLLGFSLACFALTLPATILLGWIIMRRRDAQGAP